MSEQYPPSASSVPVRCPHCGQEYAMSAGQQAQYVGRAIQCTTCHQTFTVGQAGPQGVATFPATAGYDGGPAGAAYPTPYATPAGYGSPVARRTEGTAVMALVLGILAVVAPVILLATLMQGMTALVVLVLASLAAIICGGIGISRTNRPGVGGKGLAVGGLVLGIVTLLLGGLSMSILVPSLGRARETANRVKCASNLKQIGQGLLLYANENNGRYPARIEELYETEDLTTPVFVCPSSSDTPAGGATPAAVTKNIAAGGHLSYVYLGKGRNFNTAPNAVVVYEPLANHGGQGCNVLFGDGHVSFISKATAATMIQQLQAGQNPPPATFGQ